MRMSSSRFAPQAQRFKQIRAGRPLDAGAHDRKRRGEGRRPPPAISRIDAGIAIESGPDHLPAGLAFESSTEAEK
jgi:hypothetical protein